jgi:hypothetical protein
MNIYKIFCCGIFHLLRDRAGSSIPQFATFMFTLFLVQLSFYGLTGLYRIITGVTFFNSGYMGYCFSLIFGIPNYLFVFRNSKFMDHYHVRMHSLAVISVIAFVFIVSLSLIIIAGPDR